MDETDGWKVVLMAQAEKDLRRVNPRDLPAITAAIDAMAHGPAQGDFRKAPRPARRVAPSRGRLAHPFFRPDFERRTVVVLRILLRGSAYSR